jgi:hypothetical protein
MPKRCCIICRKPLNSGIMISGRGICKCCEERVISTGMDTDFYNYYKNCIRKNIAEAVIRGEENSCQDYRY